jgi:hypothetical protein
MTVSQLRALLANLPDDMPVRFLADMGSIVSDSATVEVGPSDLGNGDYDGPDVVYIDIE